MPSSIRVSTKVTVIAMTAVLYALAKGATAFISTPWGVGQLLIGIFVPAFMAVVADTFAVAVGAGLGTFLGDVFFLTPLGQTNPVLSLVAGVPANFFAFLLFGWFVKRYRSWSAFIAATVSFVTLGNLIAAFSVVVIGSALFTNMQKAFSVFNPAGLILGFTVFWASTMIPAILVAVPLLVRAVRPLEGRTSVLTDYPSWSSVGIKSQLRASIIFGIVFLLLGIFFFVASPDSLVIFPGLTSFFVVAVVSVLILGPLAGVVAGSRLSGGGDGTKSL